ncbi:MAG: MG2 domain-containing protein [Kofleriaceae bacterium]
MKRYLAIAGIIAGAILIGRIDTHDGRCESAFMDYGLTMYACPSGTIRQTAQMHVSNLRRGIDATVTLNAAAHYTIASADEVQSLEVPEIQTVQLSLVDAKNVATPLPATRKRNTFTFKVPEVPDGDYKLRAAFTTRVGAGTLEAGIPLYTPARVHVLTDRPLYEPGNVVRFRAVVLRARDLAPLDGRPGHWLVRDPDGEVLLEETAPATDWGVVAGTFPIDKQAKTGEWTIAWESGAARDEVRFKVEPFKLPRFRVDVAAEKPFYRAGDKPSVKGSVVYSSGAPVAKAKLEIEWTIDGEWPPPLDWQEKLLPKTAEAQANGRFELALPQVPADLQGTVTMTAKIAALDPAGDRVEQRTSVLLSQDGIAVSSVTELGNGLVEGFNNRMYLRVTTPDGNVVRKTKINVKRAWEANDAGIDAEVDEDGVASVQIDPGAPVNIVIPALPYRPSPKVALVTRGEIEDLIGGEVSMADQVRMDQWLEPMGACAKWVGATSTDGEDESDGSSAHLGMRVDRNGGIVAVGSNPSPLGKCAANIAKGQRLAAGGERLLTVEFSFEDPELSTLNAEIVSAFDGPEEFTTSVSNLAKSTRDCLPKIAGEVPRALTWRVTRGSKDVQLGPWIDTPLDEGEASAASALGCIQGKYGGRIALSEPATSDALGIIRFSLTPPEGESQERPQATTMLGYELVVSAPEVEGKPSTKLRVLPGQVPQLRLRVNPILAKVGDKVTAELIRGPEFTGTLPKELVVKHLKGEAKVKLDENRRAEITIDDKAEGWVEITGAGQRALVFVKPQRELTVTVEPKQPAYKPGDQAELDVHTKIAGKGGKAAVGLFGVDASLGQIASLEGADSLARVQPQVQTNEPAFGFLDGQALTLGRIRGPNAAAATVLRVSAIPAPPELDAVITATARTMFDPVEELTDNFYTVLAELHAQARVWEKSAPATEKMQPPAMAKLWKQALAACKARGEKVVDAYGRELRLSMLPGDLLSLTDPRAVIVVGTRLPEDVENWAAWVKKEKP